jgi:pilus assembly protein Flp/PilA
MTKILQFLQREDGPTSIEYAVMLALIIVVCIGAITLAGGEVASLWGDSRQAIESAIDG